MKTENIMENGVAADNLVLMEEWIWKRLAEEFKSTITYFSWKDTG